MSDRTQAGVPVKKPYRTPRLTVHGSVDTITQTGRHSRLPEKWFPHFGAGSRIRPH